ncbi:SOS response-associated peptidase [Anoxybacterium hadale]|uniref:SOS response-associated peptidase n=1 Tax=Anoxybacterium hadale TaxID=3408580 RepID=A0ACD1AAX8_9FIRM|nr:SOS response-associated peptidase [Clostridiales bacterium]
MCGRYTFFTDKELQEVDEIIDQISNEILLEKMKAGEIFPTNAAPVLLPQGELVIPRIMIWGFPNFRNKGVIINARSETAREKKLFGPSLVNRRCVIPSTGFYEWDRHKRKFLFSMSDSKMLYMAGIYSKFEEENRFVILTTGANRSMEQVHDRMPVILPKNRIKDWLLDANQLDDILFGNQPELVKSEADGNQLELVSIMDGA